MKYLIYELCDKVYIRCDYGNWDDWCYTNDVSLAYQFTSKYDAETFCKDNCTGYTMLTIIEVY
jgi:hypothetical protein